MKIYNPTGFSSSLTGSFSGSVKGTLTATGNILPVSDQVFDLGSSNKRFRDIYLSSASIYLGNKVISEDNVVTTASLATALPGGTLSGSAQIASDISGSFTSVSASIASDLVTNYLKNTTDTLDGDLTVTGTVTAQEFHTEYVSASIIYQSGSTKFGDSTDDTHELTGSLILSTGSKITVRSDSETTSSIVEYYYNTNYNMGLLSEGDRGLRLYSNTGDTSGKLTFYTEGSEAMRINSSGNVGIGSTSPASRLNLKEANTGTEGFIVTNWNNVNTVLLGSDNTTGGGKLSLKTNGGTTNVFISAYTDSYFNGGNVGINATNPDTKLRIDASDNNQLKLNRTGVGAYKLFVESGGGFVFEDDGTETLRIDASGRVGIGTTPDGLWSTSYDALQIGLGGSIYAHSSAGNAMKIGSNIVYEGTAPNYYDKYLSNSTATKYEQDDGRHIWYVAGSGTAGNTVSWTEAMRITDSGNVGIGSTNPASTLDIQTNGSAGIARISADGNGAVYSANGDVQLYTNDAAYSTNIYAANKGDLLFRVQNDGKVGIATTNFSARLELGAGGFILKGSRSLFSPSYTSDGLFNANATPNFIAVSGYPSTYSKFSGQAGLILGYQDTGTGLYSPAYGFEVKSTDGIPVTGRVVDALVMHDVDTDAKPWIVKNNGSTFISNTDPELTLIRSNNSTTPAARVSFATSQGTVKWQIGTNQAVGAGLEINQGNAASNRVYIDTDGSVGINKTSLNAQLEVQNSSSGKPTLLLANESGGGTNFEFQRWQYVASSTSFRLGLFQEVSAGLVKYRFDLVNNGSSYNSNLVLDRGAVGIGESSPDHKLHVNGGTTNIVAHFQSTDGTGGIKLSDSTGNVELTTSAAGGFNVQPGGGTSVFTVNNAGEIYIKPGATYSQTYTYADAWTTSFQDVVPTGTLNGGRVYLFTIWTNSFGQAPYYAAASTIITTAQNTNSGGGGSPIDMLTAHHVSSSSYWQIQMTTATNSTNGVQVKLVNGPTGTAPAVFIRVTELSDF